MYRNDIVGKKLYYKQEKLGEIVDLKRNALGSHHEIAVVETSKNDFKVVPTDYLKPVEDRCEFDSDKTLIENFPAFSNLEIENDSDELKNAIIKHFGKPETWGDHKTASHEKHDQGYMGANATHNRGAEGNESLKGKVDYDKIKGND